MSWDKMLKQYREQQWLEMGLKRKSEANLAKPCLESYIKELISIKGLPLC
jgi:hypothetical protein